MSTWYYKDKVFELPDEFTKDDWYGFVYCITNTENNRKYIGKKFFWSKKTLPKTKTRKRRKITYKESDWRSYWGSNKHLTEEVSEFGYDGYHREILHLCKNKAECAYLEAKEQIYRGVLLSDEYYNGIVNLRCGARGLDRLKNLEEDQ